MANSVDERIVEAKFDARDFEKGVDKTIKKLDELKDSLKLKESGKSITEFSQKTSESMEKAEGALEKLSERFSTFKGLIKQQLLSGLANEVSSAFLKIEQSALNLARQLGSQQVAAGMNKYTDLLSSVRTLVVSGETEDSAYKSVERLQTYSDQTNASLEHMVGLMTKLKSSGSTLSDAQKSVEGLSNAAASMGVNMSYWPAIYNNWAQAYGRGKMLYQDWQTMETFNMVGEEFTKVILDAAVAEGTLTREISKNGETFYQTSNKVDKTIKKSKKVTQDKALKELMSFGFMTKKVMDRVTSTYYFEPIKEEQLEEFEKRVKTYGIESLSTLEQLQYKSFKAGQEARSFTDAMNTLKNAISTGWKDSFQIIFGKLDEATDFFTWLSDNELVSAIRSIGDFRNEVLTAWGVAFADGGIFKKGKTGRDMLIEALKNIDELIGVVHSGFESLFPEEFNQALERNLTFAESLGRKLGYMTKSFRDATRTILDFFTVVETEGENAGERVLKPEYLARFQKIGSGIAGVFGVLQKVFSKASEAFGKIFYAVQPLVDSIGDAIGSVLRPMADLNSNEDFFQDITNSIDNLITVLKPAVDILAPVIRFLGELGGVFVDLAIGTITTNVQLLSEALGLIIELFGGTSAQKANEGVGIIEGWGQDIQAFADICKDGFQAITAFFGILFDNIREIFGLKEETEGKKGGLFDGIAQFFETSEFVQTVKDGTKKAVDSAKKLVLSLPSRIGKLAKSMWKSLDELLFGEKRMTVWMDKDGKRTAMVTRVKKGFSLWLDNTIDGIKNWVKSIPKSLTDLWKTIGDFLFGKQVVSEVTDDSGNKKQITTRVKEGFSKWLSDTVAEVKAWIGSIPGKIAEVWQKVVDFFFGIETASKVKDPETGKETVIVEKVKSGFINWLTGLKGKIAGWVKEIPDKFTAVWQVITDTFFSKEVEGQVEEPTGDGSNEAAEIVRSGFNTWLTDTIEKVKGWAKEIPEKVKGLWNDVLNAFFGLGEKTPFDAAMFNNLMNHGMSTEALKYKETWEKENQPIKVAVTSAVESLGETIGGVIAGLPERIAKGFSFKIDLLDILIGKVTDFFKKKNEAKDLADTTQSLLDKTAEEASTEITGESSASPFMTAVIELGQKIAKLVTETIPGFLTEGWTFVSEKGSGWWDIAVGIFDNFVSGGGLNDIQQKVVGIGKTIRDFIYDLPGYIRSGVDGVIKVLTYKPPMEKIGNAMTKPFFMKGMDDGIHAVMENADRGLKDATTSIWDMIQEIGKAIGSAFVSLGPYILDGLNRAIQWINEKISDFTKFLVDKPDDKPLSEAIAEKMEGASDENRAFYGMVKEVGESMKKTITDVVPSFVEEGVKEVSAKVPSLLDKLFDLIIPSAKADSVDSNAQAEGAVAGLNSVSDVLDAADKAAQTGENLIKKADKIAEIQQALADAQAAQTDAYNLGQYDELIEITKEIQKYENWLKILTKEQGEMIDPAILKEMKVSEKHTFDFVGSFQNILNTITHIGGSTELMGTITVIGGLIMVVQSIRDMFSVTDEVESFGYKAKWEALKVAILGVVAILGWVSYLASSAAENPDDTRYDKTIEALDKMVEFAERLGTVFTILAGLSLGKSVAEAFESFGSAKEAKYSFGQKGNPWLSFIGGVLGKLADVGLLNLASDAFGNSIESMFDSITSTINDVGTGVETFISSIKPAITDLANMAGTLDQAISAVGKVADLLAKFYDMIGLVGISVAETDEGTKAFMDAAQVMSTGDNKERSVVFLADQLERRMTFMFQLTTMMENLAESIKNFENIKDAETQISRMLEVVQTGTFTDLVKQVVNVIYGSLVSTFGGSMVNLDSAAIGFEMLGNAFEVLGSAMSGLELSDITNFQEMLKVVDALATTLASVNDGNGAAWHELVFGNKTISKYGKEIKQFGVYMKGFFTNISNLTGTTSSEDDLKRTQTRIDMVLQIAKGLAETSVILNKLGAGDAGEYLTDFGPQLGQFGTDVGSFISAVGTSLDKGIDLTKIEIIAKGVTAMADLVTGFSKLGDGLRGYTAEQAVQLFSSMMTGLAENSFDGSGMFAIGAKAGFNLDAGLAQGISTGAAILAAQKLAHAISGSFRVSWQMHSPSKLAASFGENWDEGLKEGIEDSAKDPAQAAAEAAQRIIDDANRILSDPKSTDAEKEWARMAIREMTTGFEKYAPEAEKAAEKFAQGTGETLRAATKKEIIDRFKEDATKKVWDNLFGNGLSSIIKTSNGATRVNRFVEVTEGWNEQWQNIYKGMTIQTLRTLGTALAENTTNALFSTGIFNDGASNWSEEETVTNLCTIVAGIMQDVQSKSGDAYTSFAVGMVGDIMTAVKDEYGKGNTDLGSVIADVMTASMQNYTTDQFGAMAGALLGGLTQSIKEQINQNGGDLMAGLIAGITNYKPDTMGLIGALLFGTGNKAADPVTEVTDNFNTFLADLASFTWGDNEIQPRIVPVVDLTNVEEAQKELNMMGWFTNPFAPNFDLTGLNRNAQGANPNTNRETAPASDYTDTLRQTNALLASIGANMPKSLANTNLKVVLDSGALVGGIIGDLDSAMGRQGFYAGRE